MQPPKNGELPEDSHSALSSISLQHDSEHCPLLETSTTSLPTQESLQFSQTSISSFNPSHESSYFPETSASSFQHIHERSLPTDSSTSVSDRDHTSVHDTYSTLEYQAGTTNAIATPTRPQYDPKQLLNPKAFDNVKRQKQGVRDSATMSTNIIDPLQPTEVTTPQFIFNSLDHDTVKRPHIEAESSGLGGLIERVHNVSAREERPIKKLKIQHTDEDEIATPKVAFGGSGKGGEIGEYMRMKRKEGREEAVQTFSVVDLTTGGASLNDA